MPMPSNIKRYCYLQKNDCRENAVVHVDEYELIVASYTLNAVIFHLCGNKATAEMQR